jgi:hypothetical protein
VAAFGNPTNSHCAPTVCIQVPMLLASTASHSILNTRCWSGAQGEIAEGAVATLFAGVLELVHCFDA